MATRICNRCFSDLAPDRDFCRKCFQREPPLARVVVLLGVAGLPLLIAGMLGFNSRLSLIGGVISGAAVLLHVVLAMR